MGGVGVGFSRTLGVRIGFVCPTPTVQMNHFLHHTPNLGIPVEMVQFLKWKESIAAVVPFATTNSMSRDFHLFLQSKRKIK